MFRLRIHKTVFGKYNFIESHLQFKSKKRLDKFHWLINDKKLSNNVSRAKSNIFNIVNFNKFELFYTQTISSSFARTDLKRLISRFNEITRYLRKCFPDESFYYLVVPEYHSDGCSWHLHGFLSEGYKRVSYINKNGFLSLSSFDKIGHNSASLIRNYEACCKYMTKYITKDLAKSVLKGDRLFYCSQGLIRGNLQDDYVISQIAPIHFDFKNDFVFKSTVDEEKYYNFITSIDTLERFNYYNVK